MKNEKWKMENGKWKMENGKWKMEKGKGSETEGEGVTRERQKKPWKGEYPKCSRVFFSRLEERR
jgi:hypothetical protein